MRRAIFVFLLVANVTVAQQPLFRVVDLDVGATERVRVADGKSATVKLLSTSETRDRVRSAIRDARVDVEINGASATLSCGNYPSSSGRRQRASRLRSYQSLLPRHQRRPLGTGQRRPPATLARCVAVHAGRLFCLSGAAALVRHANTDGQRADLRGQR